MIRGWPAALCLLWATSSFAVVPQSIPGDADCDGLRVDSDVRHLQVELVDGDGTQLDAVDQGTVSSCTGADVNGDGLVTAADLSALLAFLSGQGTTVVARGPVITYLGLAGADGTLIDPVVGGTVPLFQHPGRFGFRLVVEATRGPSGAFVGQSVFRSAPGNPAVRPDLQMIISNPLGNGDPTVCEEGGGVPPVQPANFGAAQDIADAMNDIGCRFEVITNQAVACTIDAFGAHRFADQRTRVQFCLSVSTLEGFVDGDTVVTVQVADEEGNFGVARQMIAHIGSEPVDTPTRTSTRPPFPTATPTPSRPPTVSPTVTRSGQPTATRTRTMPTATRTSTVPSPTRSGTRTRSATPTLTPLISPTPSSSRTRTLTSTPTGSITATRSRTPTRSATLERSQTPTLTRPPTRTRTSEPTLSPTRTRTQTRVPGATFTPTPTPTSTPTRVPTRTRTRTRSVTPTVTRTGPIPRTRTPTRSASAAVTHTRTRTITGTRPATETPTRTATGVGPTRTRTPSATRTITGSRTPLSPTRTRTGSITPTRTLSRTITRTRTPTATGTLRNTDTPTRTGTRTLTRTITRTPTITRTLTRTPVPTTTRTATITRTITRTATTTRTRTMTRTPTITRTRTITRTPTQTPRPGGEVTFIGIARPNDELTTPSGTTPEGYPIFTRPLGYGFTIVIEGAAIIGGPSPTPEIQRPIGGSAFNHDPRNPSVRPDIQIIVSRALGNGSGTVCDDRPPMIGGVPASSSFDLTQPISNAINDFACRFLDGSGLPQGRGMSADACTRFPDGEYRFAGTSRMQFCASIAPPFGFPIGDTTVSVRLSDLNGVPGPPKSFVIRVLE